MEKLKKTNPFVINSYESLLLKDEFLDDLNESFIQILLPLFKIKNIEYEHSFDDSKFLLFLIFKSYRKKEINIDNLSLISDFEKYCNQFFIKQVVKAEYDPSKSILMIFKERHQKRMTNMKNVISYEESVKKLFD